MRKQNFHFSLNHTAAWSVIGAVIICQQLAICQIQLKIHNKTEQKDLPRKANLKNEVAAQQREFD